MKQTMPTSPKQMKNKTVIYLAKGEKEETALLKRRAIADYFGFAELSVSDKGKPIITEPKGYGISVSHSSGVIALAIAPMDIGIDIEKRKSPVSQRLYAFFHESERNEDFYSLWVKKEAWGKLTGDGVFVQKGKRLETDAVFTDISAEISRFADKPFSAFIATPDYPTKIELKLLI